VGLFSTYLNRAEIHGFFGGLVADPLLGEGHDTQDDERHGDDAVSFHKKSV
jgi:hypothetical protein